MLKKVYFESLDPKNCKTVWKVCKLLYKSTGTSFPVLKSYNKIAKTGKEKAELINKHFVSCFLSTCGTNCI